MNILANKIKVNDRDLTLLQYPLETPVKVEIVQAFGQPQEVQLFCNIVKNNQIRLIFGDKIDKTSVASMFQIFAQNKIIDNIIFLGFNNKNNTIDDKFLFSLLSCQSDNLKFLLQHCQYFHFSYFKEFQIQPILAILQLNLQSEKNIIFQSCSLQSQFLLQLLQLKKNQYKRQNSGFELNQFKLELINIELELTDDVKTLSQSNQTLLVDLLINKLKVINNINYFDLNEIIFNNLNKNVFNNITFLQLKQTNLFDWQILNFCNNHLSNFTQLQTLDFQMNYITNQSFLQLIFKLNSKTFKQLNMQNNKISFTDDFVKIFEQLLIAGNRTNFELQINLQNNFIYCEQNQIEKFQKFCNFENNYILNANSTQKDINQFDFQITKFILYQYFNNMYQQYVLSNQLQWSRDVNYLRANLFNVEDQQINQFKIESQTAYFKNIFSLKRQFENKIDNQLFNTIIQPDLLLNDNITQIFDNIGFDIQQLNISQAILLNSNLGQIKLDLNNLIQLTTYYDNIMQIRSKQLSNLQILTLLDDHLNEQQFSNVLDIINSNKGSNQIKILELPSVLQQHITCLQQNQFIQKILFQNLICIQFKDHLATNQIFPQFQDYQTFNEIPFFIVMQEIFIKKTMKQLKLQSTQEPETNILQQITDKQQQYQKLQLNQNEEKYQPQENVSDLIQCAEQDLSFENNNEIEFQQQQIISKQANQQVNIPRQSKPGKNYLQSSDIDDRPNKQQPVQPQGRFFQQFNKMLDREKQFFNGQTPKFEPTQTVQHVKQQEVKEVQNAVMKQQISDLQKQIQELKQQKLIEQQQPQEKIQEKQTLQESNTEIVPIKVIQKHKCSNINSSKQLNTVQTVKKIIDNGNNKQIKVDVQKSQQDYQQIDEDEQITHKQLQQSVPAQQIFKQQMLNQSNRNILLNQNIQTHDILKQKQLEIQMQKQRIYQLQRLNNTDSKVKSQNVQQFNKSDYNDYQEIDTDQLTQPQVYFEEYQQNPIQQVQKPQSYQQSYSLLQNTKSKLNSQYNEVQQNKNINQKPNLTLFDFNQSKFQNNQYSQLVSNISKKQNNIQLKTYVQQQENNYNNQLTQIKPILNIVQSVGNDIIKQDIIKIRKTKLSIE